MTAVRTIQEELAQAMAILRRAQVDTSQLDAEVLMAHALGVPRVHVISYPGQRLRHDVAHRFEEMIARRAKREPLAYITDEKEFWGLSFDVTPAALIPRPETETLVEAALSSLKGRANPLVADIGAGSGCVAIAIVIELPDAVVYATEVSSDAAALARRNALKHQVEIRVAVLEGDLFGPISEDLRGKLDAVVSNPPYIPSAEMDFLQPEIANYEPRGALDGGPDGMEYHRRILTAARDWLRPGGLVHLEVGVGQAEKVTAYAREQGYAQLRITSDLAGIGRVVSGEHA